MSDGLASLSPDWPVQTARLTLRPFVAGDFEAMHAMRADAEVARYLYGEPLSEDETRSLLARKISGSAWSREGDWLTAAAVERESGLTVGDVSLCWVSERDRTAEIGFIFDPGRQGKGFATEAARSMVDWVFTSAGFHRIIGRTEVRNDASKRVLEKLGMRLEAYFIENEWVKGEWQSELVYAILAREWIG